MANESINNLSDSLGEYLISLAESLAEAQTELDTMAEQGPYAGHRYHIPRLNFDFQVEFTLDKSDEDAGHPGYRRLMIQPIQPIGGKGGSGRKDESYEGVSHLSGSFVSVPTDSNQQLLQLESELIDRGTDAEGNRVIDINVYVDSLGGEALPGVEVEANIDHRQSETLNRRAERDYDARSQFLTEGIIQSDDEGVASTQLLVAGSVTPGTQVVIALDCQGQTEVLRYRVTEVDGS